MAPKRLIITADDMGYNVERNHGIVDCFQKNGITNSSLMVNGVAAEDAAKLALEHGLPTGLHFNIMEGLPVNADSRYSTLTNSEGYFWNLWGDVNLRKLLSEGKIDPKEVKEELNCQIARYEELMGRKPVYVDGHLYAHLFPGVVDILAETLQEHGIRASRVHHEPNLELATWETEVDMSLVKDISKGAELARPVLQAHNIWASDAFYGFMTMGKNMTTERLQTGIMRLFDSLAISADTDQPITCELMTHPGYACKGPGGCGKGPDEFSMSSDREHEMSVLVSEEMQNFYKANNIEVVPYDKCL